MLNQRIEDITIKDKHNRQDYSRDKARIIHSASFRRLQGKTQILGLGESDFYRNRLTHSLEVAQIAGGILNQFLQKDMYNRYFSDMPCDFLLDAISLAHDIGHPPFGHAGEIALNYCMSKYNLGFEANAQTMRICTLLGEYSDNNGFNLTRRVLLGMVKYPTTFDKVKINYSSSKIQDFKPPKYCFYDDNILNWLLEPFENKDKDLFVSIQSNKTIYKTLDCSIMELADDIAYGIHDLEDAIQLGIIDKSKWIEQVIEIYQQNEDLYGKSDIEKINALTNNLFGNQRQRKHAISRLVHHFISHVELEKNDIFMHQLFALNAVLPQNIKAQLELIKRFILVNEIFKFEVTSLNYKGQQMIVKLFEAIADNPKYLMPPSDYQKYNETNDIRIICDYIAGTTDRYLVKIYERIFIPNKGSVFDKL